MDKVDLILLVDEALEDISLGSLYVVHYVLDRILVFIKVVSAINGIAKRGKEQKQEERLPHRRVEQDVLEL